MPLSTRDLARRIGLLPQTADVHWDVDVATLVALGRYPHRSRWGETEADRAAVADAMAATDVTQFADRADDAPVRRRARPRAAGARAGRASPNGCWPMNRSPTSIPRTSSMRCDACAMLRGRGAGVIVVLHDLNHALRAADDVLLLSGGKVAAFGPPEAVLTREIIAKTYGVDTHIGQTPEGQRFLVATHRAQADHG